jgi:hypothetical protein
MNKINQNWVFGQGAGLSFASSNPAPLSGFAINTGEGCASISDANGNLLFYTDGMKVWDHTHTQRVINLSGNSSSTQSAIIVPNPANSSEYYIFTADGASGGNNHVNGILLNINTWLPGPSLIFPSTVGFSPTEKITAIQHRNCKDYWVVTLLQKTGVNSSPTGPGYFRVFQVNTSGFTHVADTVIGPNTNVHDLGYLKASPDGSRIAFANWSLANVLLFPFDNSNGNIAVGSLINLPAPNPLPISMTNSNPNIGHARSVYGVEFSPGSQILYYSVIGGSTTIGNPGRGYVYQIDLLSNTQLLVGTHDNIDANFYAIGALQLGMNKVIYIAQSGESFLGAILNPDTIGTGCNVNWNQIALSTGTRCNLGLPNLLPNPCDHDCNCGCTGCNDKAEEQNEELIVRAKTKFNTVKSRNTCANPFGKNCDTSAVNSQVNLEPCFYFHWGDGSNDQIEEHDTEVFYLTVCNPFKDIQYNGFRITKVTLIPNIHPLDKIQIVPDRFICLDCIEPCSCQTREFAMITRATDTAGNYKMEVEYCFESVTLSDLSNSGKVQFDLEITED